MHSPKCKRLFQSINLVIVFLALVTAGCSTLFKGSQSKTEPVRQPSSDLSTTSPNPAATALPLPSPPEYTKMIYPERVEISELVRLFQDPSAPKVEDFPQECSSDFYRLKALVQDKDELARGIRELVRADPVHYHWCFYARILKFENELKKDTYNDEKQKLILDEFEFLAPVAKSFMIDFHESRYFRWAVARYQKLSQLYFYRRVELNAQGTSELVEAANPLGSWSYPKDDLSVLNKYHFIASTLGPAALTAPVIPSTAPVVVTPVPPSTSSAIVVAPAAPLTETPTPSSVPPATLPPSVEPPSAPVKSESVSIQQTPAQTAVQNSSQTSTAVPEQIQPVQAIPTAATTLAPETPPAALTVPVADLPPSSAATPAQAAPPVTETLPAAVTPPTTAPAPTAPPVQESSLPSVSPSVPVPSAAAAPAIIPNEIPAPAVPQNKGETLPTTAPSSVVVPDGKK